MSSDSITVLHISKAAMKTLEYNLVKYCLEGMVLLISHVLRFKGIKTIDCKTI